MSWLKKVLTKVLYSFIAWLVNRIVDPTKPLGTYLFNAFARVTVSTGVEGVLLKRDEQNRVFVYMTRRKSGESYAGQWHCPGSIVRTERTGRRDWLPLAIGRIYDEIGLTSINWSFVGEPFFWREERGVICSLVYLLELDGSREPEGGEWFSLNSLPYDNMVPSHRDNIIPMAVKAFMARSGPK